MTNSTQHTSTSRQAEGSSQARTDYLRHRHLSVLLICLVRPEEGQPGGLEGAPDGHLLRRRSSSGALAEAPEADPVAAPHRQLLPAVRPPGQCAHLRPN